MYAVKQTILTVFFIALLAAGIVFAAGNTDGKGSSPSTAPTAENTSPQNNGQDSGAGIQVTAETATQNQGANTQIRVQEETQVNAEGVSVNASANGEARSAAGSENREYADDRGEKVELREGNGTTLQVKGIEARSTITLVPTRAQNRTELRATLSNGKNADIKVMPDTASATAIARLQLKECNSTNNCSIELKEVGQGEQVKAAYEVKAEKETRVLGVFGAKMQVQAQVDAETGTVLETRKPWWAFLAVE